MTSRDRLERYLTEFRHRLRRLILARGVAASALVVLVVTVGAVYVGRRYAFADDVILASRLILLLALALAAAQLLIYPLRKLRRLDGALEIEQRAPAFGGRVETYLELSRREAGSDKPEPLLELLADDTAKVADTTPATKNVPTRQLTLPLALAAASLAALVWLGAFAPDGWRHGARHFWAGWLFSNAMPPQSIVVTPGDTTVRRGGDVHVAARFEGFDPAEAAIFARFEGADEWENAAMRPTEGSSFEFTFLGVREPLVYYIAAAGKQSVRYDVRVVETPRVTNIKLTYRYPDWTRMEELVEDPGGDIRAVAGTEVEVDVSADRAMDRGELVVNGESRPLEGRDLTGSGTIEVTEEGEYYIAAYAGEDRVPLTEPFFITLVPDKKPVVKVQKPGRDWQATNIEEVKLRLQAKDDFGLEDLALHYSVNGSEWQETSLEFAADGALTEHMLFLEEMGGETEIVAAVEDAIEDASAGDEDDDGGLGPQLVPGDLISYYLVAEDHEQSARTDLYFIEVRPFDRRFSQSQQSGAPGQGQPEDEISRRQKEILVATWNLLRDQAEPVPEDAEEDEPEDREAQIKDSAAMLGELQRTLSEQAKTLAQRARARQLTTGDEKIATFVENLELAAEAMIPAADHLSDGSLQEAVQPEQLALQHLLRAEAVFTDIQVAFSQSQGGGSQGQRDLAELFELEMDLEKNQYESGAGMPSQQQDQEIADAIRKLQELARRQESLAEEVERQASPTMAQRWRQEMLRREAEELKRELDRLRQQRSNQQQQAQSQQAGAESEGQEGEQSEQGSPPQQASLQPGSPQQQSSQGSPQQSGSPQQAGTPQQAGMPQQPGSPEQAGSPQQGAPMDGGSEGLRALENAIQAMNEASRAGGSEGDPDQFGRAAEEARRQLEQALQQMAGERQQEIQSAFSDIAERASELYAEQQDISRALSGALDDDDAPSGFTSTEELERAFEVADRKRAMQADLEALEREMQEATRRYPGAAPEATERLEKALKNLQHSEVAPRLAIAADYIERGRIADVAGTEIIISSALRRLRTDTQAAAELAAATGEYSEDDRALAATLAELQQLRRELQAATGSHEAAGGQNPAGVTDEGRWDNRDPGNNASSDGPSYLTSRRNPGSWDAPPPPMSAAGPLTAAELEERLRDASRQVLQLTSRLRAEGISNADMAAVRRLARAHPAAGFRGNPELLDEELRDMIALLEQLEIVVRSQTEGQGDSKVHASVPEPIPERYEEAVAEYFRRLSQAEEQRE